MSKALVFLLSGLVFIREICAAKVVLTAPIRLASTFRAHIRPTSMATPLSKGLRGISTLNSYLHSYDDEHIRPLEPPKVMHSEVPTHLLNKDIWSDKSKSAKIEETPTQQKLKELAATSRGTYRTTPVLSPEIWRKGANNNIKESDTTRALEKLADTSGGTTFKRVMDKTRQYDTPHHQLRQQKEYAWPRGGESGWDFMDENQ